MTEVTWQNKKRRVDGLSDHPMNPRKFTKAGMEALRNSIEKCGYVEPIAINTDGTILSGHARKQILLDLGLETVDVRMPSRPLTDEEQREVLIRMNANEAGEWSFDGLDWNMSELESFDFDSELLGEFFEGEAEVKGNPAGKEYDESIADNVTLCKCEKCGHEHAAK
ncbi:MAG TPA: ParB N-terminal domain-containing protein [Candidatus Kapabacteria bacterium]